MSRMMPTSLIREANIDKITPGIYRHFKGNLYKVYGVAFNEDKNERFVLYRQLYGNYTYWIRPLNMFLSLINTNFGRVGRFLITDEVNREVLWDEKMPVCAIHSEDNSTYIVNGIKRKRNTYIASKV